MVDGMLVILIKNVKFNMDEYHCNVVVTFALSLKYKMEDFYALVFGG